MRLNTYPLAQSPINQMGWLGNTVPARPAGQGIKATYLTLLTGDY
jgi:hypothetical protein